MEIVNVKSLGIVPDEQSYAPQDVRLITSTVITPTFGTAEDYVEYYIRDLNGDIVQLNYNADYKPSPTVDPTTGTFTSITVDPIADARRDGIDRGIARVKYNFFRNLLSSNIARQFWIKEISSTRTEIKVARQDLSNSELLSAFNTLSATLSTANYYPDFLLNFGLDVQLIAVNAVYVEEGDNAYIIFKLYEPLPTDYDVKSQFWVVQKVADSVEYEVSVDIQAPVVTDDSRLRGPNFKVKVNQTLGQTTPYYNYVTLLTTPFSTSYQQLLSWLDDRGISINVDYSDFGNFIHFSSATERLLNFKYKVELIEAYKADIESLNNITNAPTTIINTNTVILQNKIDNIIKKFDGYEYYLYFESASTAWPKQNDEPPHALYSVTSSEVSNWLGGIETIPTPGTGSILYTSSLYDVLNKDNLEYSMPTYIREDDINQPYMAFLNMIGQHFDNIWLYYKDVSNRYSSENNPHVGISLDLVANALRGFGMTLYTNTNVADNIYYAILGLNETGSTLPVTSSQYAQVITANSSLIPPVGSDYLSASIYLPPFGEEKINEYVTTLELLSQPPNQLEKEIYKRIYHNLPYLLKTKGTQRGVKALIACYGIPESILTVHEFGANNIFTAPIIGQMQDQKVFTGSVLHISSSLLTPYTTLQYYDNSTERGSYDIEIGFSPADSINADITSSLGNFNYMQYVADPSLQYSSSYEPLVALADNYFATNYQSRYNVWDFIRVIKYYNNSLFKMLRDFVPARASLSSGIIIKPHILERNKYARHEPITERYEYSASIDTAFISGSDAPGITVSTAYTSSVQTVSGSRKINHIYDAEKYTGEFDGLTINAHRDSPQTENSNILYPWTSSVQGATQMYTTYSLDYLYQNVTSSIASRFFFDLDYAYNQSTPVNYGLVTMSLNNIVGAYVDPYAPWAYVQDYNYSLYSFRTARYDGAKTRSKYYNIYTSGSTTTLDHTSTYRASGIAFQLSFNWFILDPLRFGSRTYSTIVIPLNTANIPASDLVYTMGLDTVLLTNLTPNINVGTNAGTTFTIVDYYVYTLSGAPTLYLAVSQDISMGASDTLIYPSPNGTIQADLTFNYYRSAQEADSSYGQTAAIDRNSYKLGWVKTIPSQSLNFSEKTIVNLKYLVDSDLNVTELNYANYNLFEVQNTFKSGDPVKVSITDVQFPTNQITLDGTKTIFRGGFRYDPIIFREGNESMTFRYDTPISQSTDYLGIRASTNFYYQYKAAGWYYITRGQPTNIPSGNPTVLQPYYWETDDPEGDNTSPMAVSEVIRTNWRYDNDIRSSHTPVLTNITPGYVIPLGTGDSISYGFNLLRFNVLRRNTEPNTNSYSNQPNYIYKVPRTGIYRIKGQAPFWMESYFFYYLSRYIGAFKPVIIVEKATDPTAADPDWSFVTATTLQQNGSIQGSLGWDSASNTVFYQNNVKASFNLKLPENTTYQLDQGDYLRFRFYLIDLANLFGSPINYGGSGGTGTAGSFYFRLAGVTNADGSTYLDSQRAFFDIEDVGSAYVANHYDSLYSPYNTPVFTTSSTDLQSLYLSPQVTNYIISASMFIPSTASLSTTYYTSVIDKFNIQVGDLIRMSPFNEYSPIYYTVLSSSYVPIGTLQPVVQLPGSFVAGPGSSYFLTNTLPSPLYWVSGMQVVVTGTANNNTVFRIQQIVDISYSIPGYYAIIFEQPCNIVNEGSRFSPINATFTTPPLLNSQVKYNIDRTIVDPFLQSSFAVLRPKPDETTVILNHRKTPGLVAQTLLIPHDANQLLLDSTGDIFESLNVQLG